jgi:hypothetical protein
MSLDLTCPISRSNMRTVAVTPCGHFADQNELRNYYKYKSLCPICKEPPLLTAERITKLKDLESKISVLQKACDEEIKNEPNSPTTYPDLSENVEVKIYVNSKSLPESHQIIVKIDENTFTYPNGETSFRKTIEKGETSAIYFDVQPNPNGSTFYSTLTKTTIVALVGFAAYFDWPIPLPFVPPLFKISLATFTAGVFLDLITGP